MAAVNDYTKFLKPEKTRIKKAIFQASQKIGSGTSNPVPYDTAWVARVPELNKLNPAFPDSLQWLRGHQSEDGSWGTDYPPSVHCKVLNTFAAVLALSQWNYPQDKERVKRGVQALELMAKTLPEAETKDKVFEVIISGLLEDARKLELNITYTHFEFHSAIGKEKLKSMEKGIMSNQPNSSWSLLEAAGGMELELECYRLEIARNGLIADQPAPTAFLLRYARMQNVDFPEAQWALEKLSAEHQGGVPHFSLCDNFEIIHGLDFSVMAGINPKNNSKHAFTQKAINLLKQRYDASNGIGFSSNWSTIDHECTKTAHRVLLKVSNQISLNIDKQPATNDSFILKNGSVKAQSIQPRLSFISKDANGICFTDEAFLNNKKNISQYYNIMQQVFEAKKQDSDVLITDIVEFICGTQNSDGGWGGECTSSAEETAYVCLAIYRLIQTNEEVVDRINFSKLVKFMEIIGNQSHQSFWCHKVNFSSPVLGEVVIACARYAIFQIQRLIAFAEALDCSKITFLEGKYTDKNNHFIYKALVPLMRPGEERVNIEVNKTEVDKACKNILGLEYLDDLLQKLVDVSLSLSYDMLNFPMSLENRVDTTLIIVSVFLLDEYFDSFLNKGKEQILEAKKVTEIGAEVLKGYHEDLSTLPDFNFPTLPPLWKWLLHSRNVLLANNCNENMVEKFISLWEKHGFLKYNVKAHEIACNEGIVPTAKLYITCHKHMVALDEMVYYYIALLADNTFDSKEFEDNELLMKFRDCARKASRILIDVFSIQKDVALDDLDNYCLVVKKEYKLSAGKAMRRATLKANKEILKMYFYKKVVFENPKNKENKALVLGVEYVERFLHGCIVWSMTNPRYQVGLWKMATEKVCPEKVGLQFCWEFGFNHDDEF